MIPFLHSQAMNIVTVADKKKKKFKNSYKILRKKKHALILILIAGLELQGGNGLCGPWSWPLCLLKSFP